MFTFKRFSILAFVLMLLVGYLPAMANYESDVSTQSFCLEVEKNELSVGTDSPCSDEDCEDHQCCVHTCSVGHCSILPGRVELYFIDSDGAHRALYEFQISEPFGASLKRPPIA